MKHQEPDNRIRPGFAVLLALALAAVSIAVWMSVSKPTHPATANVSAVASKHTTHSKHKDGAEQAPAAAPVVTEPALAVPSEPIVAAAAETATPIPPPPNGTPSPFEAQWGIRISDVMQTHTESVLEMSYIVVDPAKIATLSDGVNTPYLIEQASGAKVMLCVPMHEKWPFAGHSRARSMALISNGAGGFPPAAGKVVPGRTYSLLIPNPDLTVKKGSRVAVSVGDIRSDILAVE